jgi:hypothetical protein
MSSSDHLHSLAAIVEDLEERGVDATVSDVFEHDDHDTLWVDLRLHVPAEISTGGSPQDSTSGEQADANQEDVDDGPESEADSEETEGGEDEFDCGECDYSSTSQRGLSIHQAKAHDDDEGGADGGEETDPFAGYTDDDLVDALEGAQSVHHVERDLGVDRDEAKRVLGALGVLGNLSTGIPAMSRDEARAVVQEAGN